MKIELPNTVDLSHPEKYGLAIFLHPETYSFLLYPVFGNEEVFFTEDRPEHLSDAFASFKDWYFDNDFFALPFGKVFVICYSPDFTFLPNEFDPDRYAADFLKYLLTDSGGIVLYNRVAGFGFNVVFSVPEAISDFFTRSFSEPQFIHHSVALIEYCNQKRLIAASMRTMVVNLERGEMTLLCYDSGELLLCNYHKAPRIQDSIYFILFTWKQMKMNQLTDNILLLGDASENFELIDNLSLFIRRIIPETLPTGFNSIGIIPFPLASFAALNV